MSSAFCDCPQCGTRNSLFNPRCIGCGERLLEGSDRTAEKPQLPDLEASSEAPHVIGGYTIVALVGSGSSARVFAAYDSDSRQPVLLKVMRPELLGSDEARKRFSREARALSRVDHPNVGRMLAVLEAPSPTLVLEVAAGRTLEDLLALGRIGGREAVQLLAQLAAALEALHTHGIVHRDVKPANIVVSDALELKLIDLGLARMLEHRPGTFRTAAGTVLGSLAYAAPEVVMGERGEAPADCWSLGVVAFELAMGQRPFDAPSRVALAAAIVAHQAGGLTAEGPLAELVQLSLKPEPAARATARELATALDAAQKSRSEGSS